MSTTLSRSRIAGLALLVATEFADARPTGARDATQAHLDNAVGALEARRFNRAAREFAQAAEFDIDVAELLPEFELACAERRHNEAFRVLVDACQAIGSVLL